jgi:hypothetical protein
MVQCKRTLLLLFTAMVLLAGCGNNRTFDSATWLKTDARTRGRMSEDLVKSKILIGQTVAEAQRLLGQPDKIYPTAMQYHIDLGYPFKDPKHYGLQVHFNSDQSVREVKIVD